MVEGGSTISQQLAKMAFLTPERSFVRKVKEALYTLWIEARFDKAKILELYLNRVYLGSGAYGVDAAARRYFAKPASDLTLAEAAMLAGLIRAPSRYAPTRDLGLARARAEVVLSTHGRDRLDHGRRTPRRPRLRPRRWPRRARAPAPATSPTGCSPRAGCMPTRISRASWCAPRSIRSCNARRRRRWRRRSPRRARPRELSRWRWSP